MEELQGTQRRVLLVEDEIRLGESIQRGIARHGHDVDLVRDCASAIDAGLRSTYDVLVLDINLPDAVGWDALTAFDAARRRPRTIVLSAIAPSAARVREFSPISVLEKPFPIDALLRLIEHPAGAGQSDLPVIEGSNIQ
jgi:two-component system, OmpR family, response regulator